MRAWLIGGAVTLATVATAARAQGCEDFRTIASMTKEVVATHERGADPNWFDDSSQLSDLSLLGESCTIEQSDGVVANVTCGLHIPDNFKLDDLFDVAEECLKGSVSKISRDPGREDHIWTTGAMLKIWGDDKHAMAKFVY